VADAPPLTGLICAPDPDNPGWHEWRVADPGWFNAAVLGKQIARAEGADKCRLRMVPKVPAHTNIAGKVHGGIILSLIDVSLFSALYVLRGIDAGRSVTLDLQTQFIGGGDASRPLDAVAEVLRETRRLAFLRGLVVQEDDLVASFTATVRKPSAS